MAARSEVPWQATPPGGPKDCRSRCGLIATVRTLHGRGLSMPLAILLALRPTRPIALRDAPAKPVRWGRRAHALSVAACLGLLPLAAGWRVARAAEASTPEPDRFGSFIVDNDFFAGYDQHYTNGFQLAVSAERTALSRAMRSRSPFGCNEDRQFTLSIGQRIYTPNDKSRVEPDPLDRPYGGWLYALADERCRTGRAVDSVQLSVGVMGPAAFARQTQNGYHALIGNDRSRGWDSQLRNQPALLLGYERSWPSLVNTKLGFLDVDLTPRVGATIGNVYTYASTGAVVRLGQNLPDDFPVTHISLGPPRDGYRPADTRFGWYFWFGTDVRLVGWNAFLDRKPPGEPGVRRKPLGGDLQLGAACVWGKARIAFTFVKRSREFETQAKDDEFGQLMISRAF